MSPFEVEDPLLDHPWVKIALCFSVPSKLYGEEVGCAIVLSQDAPAKLEQRDVIMALREQLKARKLAPSKFPTKWKVVDDSELPKTKTKKYIRVVSSAPGNPNLASLQCSLAPFASLALSFRGSRRRSAWTRSTTRVGRGGSSKRSSTGRSSQD